MKASNLIGVLLTASFCLSSCATQTQQSPSYGADNPAWTTLLDGQTMGDWVCLGGSHWRLDDGAIIADEKTGTAAGYLVTPETYDDFVLHVEFWSSDDANSGIFFRCLDPMNITDRNCYEANIFDQRPDPSYGTGAIVRHAEVDPMPKAGGQWNTYVIIAKGRDILVELNGVVTARLRSGLHSSGPIALQHGSGVMKFRKVMIQPL